MKRVLIITYYWPPSGGSGVQRWVKFTKYLRKYGWEPVIYTPENPDCEHADSGLGGDVPEDVEIIRTPIREPYAIYRKLTGGGSTAITTLIDPSAKPTLKKRLSVFIRGNFFIPDPRRSWVRPSVKFLTGYLERHPVDAVVTTGPPQSMHLIGRGLKRSTGVKWAADFRDPWTKMFYFGDLSMTPLAKHAHQRLEKSVIAEADAVVAVSPQVRDDFAASGARRVELVTNGYDATDFDGPAPERNDGRFKVVHTGNMGSDGNPAVLWKALAEECAADPAFRGILEIRLAGKVDPAVIRSVADAGLEDALVLPGYLPHEETIREQRCADLLILPLREGAEGGKIIPGKTFEYLAARRPVLGIGNPEGSSAAILGETGAGRMVQWDDPAAMRDFISMVRGGRFFPESAGIERYSREALSGRYAEILDSL